METTQDTPAEGLRSAEADARLIEVGHNILPRPKPPSVAIIFLQQFLSPWIYILLAVQLLWLNLVTNGLQHPASALERAGRACVARRRYAHTGDARCVAASADIPI